MLPPKVLLPLAVPTVPGPGNFDNVRLRTGIGERAGPCMLRRKLVQGSGGVPCDMLRTVVPPKPRKRYIATM